MFGERLARRSLANERHHIHRLRCGAFGREFVLGCRTLELLEGQLHLVEQSNRALRMLAVQLARQLGDLQLLVRDQGLVVGGFSLGDR